MTVVHRNAVVLAARDAARLDQAKAEARAAVNAMAGQVRQAFITDLPGQDMIYLGKEAEARAWLADPAPQPAAYPLLMAEVGVTAQTAAELAALWLTMGAQWRLVAAAIEAARMTALRDVSVAADAAAVAAAVAAMTQALSAIPPS